MSRASALLLLVTSCSLNRAQLVRESRDTGVASMDAGPTDVPIVRPDVPDLLPDTPACGPCGPEERCDGSGTCVCAPDLCTGGRECIDSRCQPCGVAGSQCCPRAGCEMGSGCDTSGMCVAVPTCGTVGASCCEGARCDGGLTCTAGTCAEPCGNDGQPCCPGEACNNDRLTCQYRILMSDTACLPCGNWGEACCAFNACFNGSNCRTVLGVRGCGP